MPSRRKIIRMTSTEIRAYLGEHSRIILVSNGFGGMPHPVPMTYGLDDNGCILITSFRKSQKVKNLERDPRSTLLVESGDTYEELKGVMVYANTEIIYEPGAVAAQMKLMRVEGELIDGVDDAMSERVRASIAKRVILRFAPLRYVSWDHAKLTGFY